MKTISSFSKTDTGNAELFTELYKDRLRYDHKRDRWLVWTGHWWADDTDGQVQRLAKSAARYRGEQALKMTTESEGHEKQLKWAANTESRRSLEAMLKLAQSEHPIADSGDQWDLDPMLLGVGNGVIDLRRGTLRAGVQTDRITLHTEIPFDPNAQCPRWEKFLAEIFSGDKDLIQFIQRAVGYCLTGETREQVMFPCYGTGANGKSTFLDVLHHVFGDYGYTLPFASFELKARNGINNDMAALVGRRFVTASETNEFERLNEARIKALTGCDPISARLLYREYFQFTPIAKYWLASNHKPEVADDSEAFWRRIRLIPFERQFGEKERDPDLSEKLKAEATGILDWAVRGCLEWRRVGLGKPQSVLEATSQYREESDILRDYLDDECVIGPSYTVPSASLWISYKGWCDRNGEKPISRSAFSRKLKTRGFQSKPIGRDKVWTWFGIALREGDAAAGVRADAEVDSLLLA